MEENKAAVQHEKASPKLLVGYGLGEIGCQMSWYMINNYLNIFYTDVVGLTGAAISAIVLIARVWDAINDPMMGQIADRTNTRWGKFRPYLMFAPPVLAIFGIPCSGPYQGYSLRSLLYRRRYGLHSLLHRLSGAAQCYRS